jgi:predicted ester cyclase
MTRDEVTEFFMRRLDDWNRRDIAALGRDYSDDAVVYSPFVGGSVTGVGGSATGRVAIEGLSRTFFAAFPDARLQWDDTLVDGDRVMLVGRLWASDAGGFMGLAPAGRSFDIPIVTLYELKDGLIVHERRIYDFTGMLVQVGALRAKPL